MVLKQHYVVLHHTDCPRPHYDLLIDPGSNQLLMGWRLERWPPAAGDSAVAMAPHRRLYLEFKGELSAGRGTVRRVAAGELSAWPQLDGSLIVLVAAEAKDIQLCLPAFSETESDETKKATPASRQPAPPREGGS